MRKRGWIFAALVCSVSFLVIIAAMTAAAFQLIFMVWSNTETAPNGRINPRFQCSFTEQALRFHELVILDPPATVLLAITKPIVGSLVRRTTYEGPRVGGNRQSYLCVNLWFIAALLAAPLGLLWWRQQRRALVTPVRGSVFAFACTACVTLAVLGLLVCAAFPIASHYSFQLRFDLHFPRATRNIDGFPTRFTLGNLENRLLTSMSVAAPTAFQSGAWKTQPRVRTAILGELVELNAEPGGIVYDYHVLTRAWFAAVCIATPVVAVLVHALLSRRRPRPDGCSACGYDLTGNASGTCPECGTRITASHIALTK